MEFYSSHQHYKRPSQLHANDSGETPLEPATAADAATVAIAKDMLQMHHGEGNSGYCANLNDYQAPLEVAVDITPSLTHAPHNTLGMLRFQNVILYITDSCTVIGRNSSTSKVHFHVAENNLVSRKHFQLLFNADCKEFFVQCISKNGIFVDDFLQRRNAGPLKLPAKCTFRFPSTEMRIWFENLAHGLAAGLLQCDNNNTASPCEGRDIASGDASRSTSAWPADRPSIIYTPLKISIPKKEYKYPYMSPAGMISTASTCPASPRQPLTLQQQHTSYSVNEKSLQGVIAKEDFFQTPSTASYNHSEKPPYSYAQLIVQAISDAADKQLTLSGIYSFIVKHYPYYRKETNKGWQNSIRHNLSLNRYFIKVARSQDEPGKGSFWRIDPDSGAKLIDHSYKKRRQRNSSGFRPSYTMPRSAPVSPSHIGTFDISRDNSPLQDIVLQSAPGSPGISTENRSSNEDLIYCALNGQQQGIIANAGNSFSSANASPCYMRTPSNYSAGNGIGALIAFKRHDAAAMASTLTPSSPPIPSLPQGHRQYPDAIYEDIATEYDGTVDSSEECDAKRPKYISEFL